MNSASVTAVLWDWALSFLIIPEEGGLWYYVIQWMLRCWMKLEAMFCHITLLLDQSLIMQWGCWHLPSHEVQKPPDQWPGSLCRGLMCNLLRLPCVVIEQESYSGLASALAVVFLWLSFLHWCHFGRLVYLFPGSSSLLDPSHSSPQGIHPFSWLFLYSHRVQGQRVLFIKSVSPLPSTMLYQTH